MMLQLLAVLLLVAPAAPSAAPLAAPARAAGEIAASSQVDAASTPQEETKPPAVDASGTPSSGEDGVDLADDVDAGADAPPETLALEPPSESVKSDLDSRLESLESAPLEEDQKQRVRELLQQAVESYLAAGEQVKSARELRRRLDALPKEQQYAAERLAKPLLPAEDVAGEPLADVEARVTAADQWLRQYREKLSDKETWLKRRTARLAEVPRQIAALREEHAGLPLDADLGVAQGAADLEQLAQRTSADLRRQAIEATIQALELELRYLQDAATLYQLERDHWTRKIAQREKRVAELREVLNQRREEEAQLAQEKARQAAADVAATRPPLLAKLADQNKLLAERRAAVAARITAATQQEVTASEQVESLIKEFARARERDQLQELSDSVGQLLRQQQASLPNLRQLRRRLIERDVDRAEIQMQQYDLQDQRKELADVDAVADEAIAAAGSLSPEEEQELRSLYQARVKYLDDLVKAYEDDFNMLTRLSMAETRLISETENYARFIAERVLWIRSCAPPRRSDLRPAGDALAWSLDPRHWGDAGRALGAAVLRRPLEFSLTLLAVALLVAGQRPARRALDASGQEAAKRGCVTLAPTLRALGLTVVLAVPWPAVAAAAARALDNPLGDSEFARALSHALRFSAVGLLLLELARRLCRAGGLADAHFEWSAAKLLAVRRAVRWLAILALPFGLWAVGLHGQGVEPLWSSSLGRACFVAAMLVMTIVLERVLLARRSPFRSRGEQAEGWRRGVGALWRSGLALSPAALAALAIVGYYYTAQQAAVRLIQTAAVLLAVLVLGGLARRWLLVNRRRLAREQARQRRAQLAAAAASGVDADVVEVVEESVDLAALSEQTRKLLRTLLTVVAGVGLLVIWNDLLPAVRYLGEHPLIPGAGAVGDDQPFTWGQLLELGVVLTMTYVGVRDIPALLELLVLQHLPLDGGARYALAMLCRYSLAAFGMTLAFNVAGLKWGSVQWLVAAMGVGLGFGLQEIFGNFVSGIILLFERPIRVGDIVTLGETSGVVNRIRMRATTIVDWDRKEYIVPNKDLVTQRLLNWTLSDTTNRIVVPVGIAYGSDTELACKLLIEAAQEQPHVLADPPPAAFFEGFGDSALSLKLVCFLPSLEHRTVTIHSLHTAIDRKFREADLEIPYPQRDMNVRLPDELADMVAALRQAPPAGALGPRRPDLDAAKKRTAG